MNTERAKSQPWRYAARGMTLIEMLVALAIFAILGVMGYRAASMAMESRQRVATEMQRWRAIANVVQVVELDLSQFVDRPGQAAGVPFDKPSLHLQSQNSAVELSFLKLDGSGGNVRRHGYRYEDGQLLQLRWPGTDDESLPDSHVLLTDTTAMRCSLVASNGQRYESWPNAKGGLGISVVAVDLELDLPDVGTIRRLIAIR